MRRRSRCFDQTDAHPVVCVSWNDAGKYIEWLNKKGGFVPTATHRYRLPSEAEWEYAARDVTSADQNLSGAQHWRFFWGDDPGYSNLCKYGNVVDPSAKKRVNWSEMADCDNRYAFTAPVGKFDPSPNFKLYDMVGNAREWTQDCYASYAGVHTDGRAWEPADKVGSCARVLRGGSWGNTPRYLRPADRGGNAPDYRYLNSGFRLARTLLPLDPWVFTSSGTRGAAPGNFFRPLQP